MSEEIEKAMSEMWVILEKSFNPKEAPLWLTLYISAKELLMCDVCYKDVSRQEVHIGLRNRVNSVICEECWKKNE